MRKQNGFTLAEMLATLGILGFLATFTMPVIMSARPNQEMIMLKKAYFNTTRVVSELINDDDLYPERDNDTTHAGFANASIKDMTDGVTEATFQNTQYSGNSKFCGLFAAKLGVRNADCTQRKSFAEGGNFTTSDGIVWSMPVSDFSSGSESIYVDVTSNSSGRNCFIDGAPAAKEGEQSNVCANNIAPDRFAITIGKYGDVEPVGNIARQYINSDKTTKKYTDFK